jgi:hypothetical protein
MPYMPAAWKRLRPRHETLESRMTRKCHVRFGGGRSEQCPPGNSPAVYPTGDRNPAIPINSSTKRRKIPRDQGRKACGSLVTSTRVPVPTANGWGSVRQARRYMREGTPVNPSRNRHLHEPRASIRMDARLDAPTRQKVDHLAKHFHQPRAAVLCHMMHWGLSQEPTGPFDQGEPHGLVRHLYLYVASELQARVEQAATAAGVKTAPWLRHMVRQMTMEDFPASWQEARSEERSHDSRTYGTRFMLRLDEPSQAKLRQFIEHFGTSRAEIIRQLIAQANDEDFPKSWQMRAAEPANPQMRRQTRGHREIP